MEPLPSFCSAFRRAVTFFPAAAVSVESGGETLKPDSFCPISFDPPIVALTFARSAVARHSELFAVSTGPVQLACTLLESREIGDHVMVLGAIERIVIRRVEPPSVNWRRASFSLQLDYQFLESAGVLEAFVNDWHTGVLPKSAWTHAAHVAVTGYVAFDHPVEAVFAEMKRGILHFNSCTGVVNGPDSGYHETLTRFWSNMITQSVREAHPKSSLEAALCSVRRFGEDRDLPALFYSFNVMRDRRARSEWVSPDQEPSPEWCGQ